MRTFLALFASLGLVGCVGGIETPGQTQDPDPAGPGGGGTGDAAVQAKQLFEDNVHPVVMANCIGCHNATGPQGNVTGFVSADPNNAYATAVGYQAVIGDWTPTGAPILTKITATTKTPSHQGINYSSDALNKITEWLSKELEARGSGGATNPAGENASQITTRLLQEWSGCMTLVNFEAADMRAWGNVNAGGGGNCKTCHSQGEYGHVAANTSTLFFPYISEDKYYLLQYFAVDLSMGLAAAKVIINDRSFEGVGNRLAPHQQHPNFDPQNNNGYAALQTFYNTTMSAKTAAPGGVCGPTKLLN
jgi:hypothetical protein